MPVRLIGFAQEWGRVPPRLVQSPSPYAASIGYSAAVRTGEWVVVAGTTSVDPRGAIVGGPSAYEQAREALRKIGAALEEAGASLDQVVQTRVYLTDVADWEEVARPRGGVRRGQAGGDDAGRGCAARPADARGDRGAGPVGVTRGERHAGDRGRAEERAGDVSAETRRTERRAECVPAERTGDTSSMGGLPTPLLRVLRASYGLRVSEAEPLTGGWDVHADSWLVRSERGPLVVREDRSLTVQSACWLDAVLEAAARGGVPVSAAVRTRAGAAGAALDDHAVTVRRYVEGATVDRDRPHEAAHAAGVLARLHAALRGVERRRPDRSRWHPELWPGDDDPEALRDPQLDSFEAAFARDGRFVDTVIHGDYWGDNLIWSAGRVAAVVDWSEARHDKAVRELARGTWEFAHNSEADGLDIGRARAFLGAYGEAAGGFERDTAEVLAPLMRHEVRLNARYSYCEAERDDDQVEREHANGLVRAFARLRELDPAQLLG